VSSRVRGLLVSLVALGSLGVTAPAQAAGAPQATPAAAPATASHWHGGVVPVARARSLPLGTVVTVEGTATTPSGAFESSFFDKGFAVQDLTAGIYVSVPTDLGVRPGQRVRATGTLRESFGLRILVPADPAADVAVRGLGLPVLPRRLHTGSVGESTEGLLVTVTARVTRGPESDLPYGYKVYVDDGSGELTIFVNVQTGIDLTGIAVGDLVTVVGFSSQFDDHYEIDPRSPSDVRRWPL
jgi:hypothetical protein